MTPNSRFTEFISDITPSETTDSRSSSAHNSLRDTLVSDSEYGPEIIRTFLGGSYKRKTAIRPVTSNGDTERPDVDIYVVVRDTTWTATPSELIEDLFSALERNRRSLNITRLKRNRCSISISTNKADMDISPLIDRGSDGYFRIGNRIAGEWYSTDPEGHTTWSAQVNKNASMRFNPMVKMVKWNRREFPTKFRHPKSIALEALVALHMDMKEAHFGQLIYNTFDGIIKAYQFERTYEQCPYIDDPVVSGGNLLGGVSGEAFCAFYDKISYFRGEAKKGLDASGQGIATKHWRNIFGPRFPAPKALKESASTTLKSTTVMSPLTFPSQASTPPNKPADFA